MNRLTRRVKEKLTIPGSCIRPVVSCTSIERLVSLVYADAPEASLTAFSTMLGHVHRRSPLIMHKSWPVCGSYGRLSSTTAGGKLRTMKAALLASDAHQPEPNQTMLSDHENEAYPSPCAIQE